MDRESNRTLEILTAVGADTALTQRALARQLGVALGLTNLYLKRLATKGLIKVVDFPRKPAARKRLRYLLTPKGISEKSRLSYEHMVYALNLYRRTRDSLRGSLEFMVGRGMKRVALYGPGEAAELAYLTLKEFGLEPIGVFAASAGGSFLGFSIRGVEDLAGEDLDGIIVATFDRPEIHVAHLVRHGVAVEKCLTLRRAAAVSNGDGGA